LHTAMVMRRAPGGAAGHDGDPQTDDEDGGDGERSTESTHPPGLFGASTTRRGRSAWGLCRRQRDR